jgi:hypothetical protein
MIGLGQKKPSVKAGTTVIGGVHFVVRCPVDQLHSSGCLRGRYLAGEMTSSQWSTSTGCGSKLVIESESADRLVEMANFPL